MNIIGNSCASSYIVRDILTEQFNNPFVWCSVTEADIIYVVRNYNNIHWENIHVDLYDNHTFKTKNVKITVDNQIIIKYPHYCLSNQPTKVDGINVFSKDIIKWATDKYIKRVSRMLTAGHPFYILGGTWEDQMMSLSTRYTYGNYTNVYILDNQGIVHDNYLVAIKNMSKIQHKLMNYVNDNIAPNL